MSPVSRRVVGAALVAYLVSLAAIVFWPTSEVPSSSVHWVYAGLQELGAPGWLTRSMVEFASNVVLFAPASLLASLLWPRRGWVWWTLVGFAGSLTIEAMQMLLLSGRSPTLSDIVANTLGALVGALVALPVRARLFSLGETHLVS